MHEMAPADAVAATEADTPSKTGAATSGAACFKSSLMRRKSFLGTAVDTRRSGGVASCLTLAKKAATSSSSNSSGAIDRSAGTATPAPPAFCEW